MSAPTITPAREGFDTYYYEFGPYAAQPLPAEPPYQPRYQSPRQPQPSARPAAEPAPASPTDELSPARFWTGTAITAVIAALVGLIGLTLSRSILQLNLPLGSSDTFSHVIVGYGLAAAGIALVAGALYAAMIHIAPRPTTYFAAVLTAVTALAALVPFTSTAPLTAQLALAIVNVVVGLIIAIFIPLAASQR